MRGRGLQYLTSKCLWKRNKKWAMHHTLFLPAFKIGALRIWRSFLGKSACAFQPVVMRWKKKYLERQPRSPFTPAKYVTYSTAEFLLLWVPFKVYWDICISVRIGKGWGEKFISCFSLQTHRQRSIRTCRCSLDFGFCCMQAFKNLIIWSLNMKSDVFLENKRKAQETTRLWAFMYELWQPPLCSCRKKRSVMVYIKCSKYNQRVCFI